MKQQSRGGVRCDLIYPYPHQHESEPDTQSMRSFSCFVSRLKIKIYIYKKEIVRVSLLLITLFSMLKTVCLRYVQRKIKGLKESTREKRDTGQRRKVTSEIKLPSKWKMFLQDSTNKEELFSLLTEKVKDFQFPENKEVN